MLTLLAKVCPPKSVQLRAATSNIIKLFTVSLIKYTFRSGLKQSGYCSIRSIVMVMAMVMGSGEIVPLSTSRQQ